MRAAPVGLLELGDGAVQVPFGQQRLAPLGVGERQGGLLPDRLRVPTVGGRPVVLQRGDLAAGPEAGVAVQRRLRKQGLGLRKAAEVGIDARHVRPYLRRARVAGRRRQRSWDGRGQAVPVVQHHQPAGISAGLIGGQAPGRRDIMIAGEGAGQFKSGIIGSRAAFQVVSIGPAGEQGGGAA